MRKCYIRKTRQIFEIFVESGSLSKTELGSAFWWPTAVMYDATVNRKRCLNGHVLQLKKSFVSLETALQEQELSEIGLQNRLERIHQNEEKLSGVVDALYQQHCQKRKKSRSSKNNFFHSGKSAGCDSHACANSKIEKKLWSRRVFFIIWERRAIKHQTPQDRRSEENHRMGSNERRCSSSPRAVRPEKVQYLKSILEGEALRPRAWGRKNNFPLAWQRLCNRYGKARVQQERLLVVEFVLCTREQVGGSCRTVWSCAGLHWSTGVRRYRRRGVDGKYFFFQVFDFA